MGACIDTTLKKKKPLATSTKKKVSTVELKKPAKEPSPFKVMTEEQLLYQYIIEDLVPSASTLEGPKYISNRVTGEVKVLRVFKNHRKLSNDGLINLKNLTNSELTRLNNDELVLISQLLTGQTVLEYLAQRSGTDCNEILKTIFSIIISIHQAKTYHGGLSFESFRFVSKGSKEIVLSQLNFTGDEDCFGSLNENNQAADWEFFGILMYTLIEGKLPYFSKQISQYRNIGNQYVQLLLQGRPTNIQWNTPLKSAAGLKKVLSAYVLRMTLHRLVRLRGKRERFGQDLYDQNTKQNINPSRPIEDQMNKFQKNRLINRLKDLLPVLDMSCREEFLKLTIGGPKLNEYEVLFSLHPDKRYDELIYRLSNSLN